MNSLQLLVDGECGQNPSEDFLVSLFSQVNVTQTSVVNDFVHIVDLLELVLLEQVSGKPLNDDVLVNQRNSLDAHFVVVLNDVLAAERSELVHVEHPLDGVVELVLKRRHVVVERVDVSPVVDSQRLQHLPDVKRVIQRLLSLSVQVVGSSEVTQELANSGKVLGELLLLGHEAEVRNILLEHELPQIVVVQVGREAVVQRLHALRVN